MRAFCFACVGLLTIACVGNAPPESHGCATTYDCPDGQTCWSVDGKTWDCVTSGPGKAGAACAAVGGPAPCGDKLACVAYGSPQDGTCRYWCDGIPCPSGSGSCVSHMTTNTFSLSNCM
jgi:hypothetical protein